MEDNHHSPGFCDSTTTCISTNNRQQITKAEADAEIINSGMCLIGTSSRLMLNASANSFVPGDYYNKPSYEQAKIHTQAQWESIYGPIPTELYYFFTAGSGHKRYINKVSNIEWISSLDKYWGNGAYADKDCNVQYQIPDTEWHCNYGYTPPCETKGKWKATGSLIGTVQQYEDGVGPLVCPYCSHPYKGQCILDDGCIENPDCNGIPCNECDEPCFILDCSSPLTCANIEGPIYACEDMVYEYTIIQKINEANGECNFEYGDVYVYLSYIGSNLIHNVDFKAPSIIYIEPGEREVKFDIEMKTLFKPGMFINIEATIGG